MALKFGFKEDLATLMCGMRSLRVVGEMTFEPRQGLSHLKKALFSLFFFPFLPLST